ncbi:hypothetical protein ACSNOK_25220, partial [Streptomyces sp. URMC 126]
STTAPPRRPPTTAPPSRPVRPSFPPEPPEPTGPPSLPIITLGPNPGRENRTNDHDLLGYDY